MLVTAMQARGILLSPAMVLELLDLSARMGLVAPATEGAHVVVM